MKTIKSKTVTLREIGKEPNFLSKTSQCSCAKCDSFSCFKLRNREQCSCKQCKGSGPCSISKRKNEIGESKSSIKVFNCGLSNTDSVIKERVKKEITYEYSNNNNVATVKKHSRYSYYTGEPRDNDTILDNDKIGTPAGVPHVHSATVVNTRKEDETHTAQLSAQIMNVPYKEFKESVSYNKSVSSPKYTKLTKYDIFRRIKEAYRACSCKVCECIAGKTPARSNYCKCKPCDCKDCADFIKTLENKEILKKSKQLYFVGCPCIRCNRTDCKGLMKNANGPAEFCDCDPCDCLKCKDSFNAPCNCKPCECIECKSYLLPKSRTTNFTVVASMQEDEPRNYCQCSPCDCAECGQHYLMSSRHEMATGMSRPDNCTCENCTSQSCEADGRQSCRCELERGIMRKPVEKDTHDYDIHRASVKNTSIPDKKAKNETITMFAAIKNNYLKLGTDNKTLCSCGDCECIICSCKNNNAIFADQKRNIEACKCSPCECEICNKNHEIIRDNGGAEPDVCNNKKDCDCCTCNCLQCDGLLQPSTSISRNYKTNLQLNKMLANKACKCSLCECTDCQNMMYNCTGDNCYCTNCKCQICSDQNKFIHETVYRNNNGCSHLPFTLVTTSGDQNPKNSRLFEKGEELKFKKTSRQNISDNLVSSDIEELDDNPVKGVTNTLMPKCLPYGVQKTGHAKHSCEANVQFRDKNIVMQNCNRKAAVYGSSGSFLSVNSLDDKSCDILNMENVNITPSLTEKTCKLSYIKSSKSIYDMSKSNKTISKCLNGFIEHDVNLKDSIFFKTAFTPTDGPEKDTDDSYNGLNFAFSKNITIRKSNSDHNVEIISPVSHDESATVSTFSGLSTGFNDDIVLSCNAKESRTSLENEISRVKKTSFDLLSSLRNANKRVSKLMHTNVFQKIQPLKTNNSLSNTMTNMKDVTEENNASGITNTSQLLTVEIDYDKMKNTLKQAKDFSGELMKILNEFKQANKRKQCKFLKKTPDSSSNINCMPKTNNFEANISKVNNSTKYERLEDEIELCGSNYNTSKKNSTHDFKIEKLEKVKSQDDIQTDKIIYDTEMLPLKRSDSSNGEFKGMNSKDTRENIKYFTNKEIADDQRGINAGSTTKSRQIEYYANEQLHEISCHKSIEDSQKPRLKEINLKNIKRSHIIRAVGVYKRLKLKEALLNLAENANLTDISTPAYSVPQSKQNIEGTNDSEELNHGSPKNKRETTTTSTHTRYEHARSMHEQVSPLQSGTEDKSWSILRKNCLIELSNIDRKGFSLIPPLQLEIKDTLRTISNLHQDNEHREPNHETEVKKLKDVTIQSATEFAENKSYGKSKLGLELKDFIASASQTINLTSSVEKAVDCMDETFSVMVLKRQIRELLNMSLTNPVQKRSLKEVEVEDSGGPSDISKLAKRSSYYDPLKAKFLSLRRVSDHTVLVKWKAPLHVNNVQGYELLIDGRSVQKIISPSRCMAVVTCLPHVEKVLITIRTMVSSAVQCAHYPSTTIVYHLRAK